MPFPVVERHPFAAARIPDLEAVFTGADPVIIFEDTWVGSDLTFYP